MVCGSGRPRDATTIDEISLMKFARIGATGNVGSRLLAEAQRRGHAVTIAY